MIDEKYRDAVPLLEKAVPLIEKTGVKIVELRDRFARIVMPFEPNINHIGIMYGGSLFILAEFSGGVIYYVSFDTTKFYPIVKEVSIRYRRPATTDVTLEVSLEPGEVEMIQQAAQKEGKKDWTMDLELKDAHGEVCSIVHGTWQLRRFPENTQ
ncbi:MAG: PaaI family thioesterase [Desulfomonilia bacterium]|jgi:thioesterase domain-containing protein|uniref:Putative thioesterase (YiiD_Cterm) n=1 Tax=anaerobic digester metagenome TaxID=1263854 RepID=A0A485LXC5_9ZZZZ|nr:PaaI family thioesterase [Pseudomonadota bacterium]HON38589.1 PaaI family thioesterase [Deltaproteobacteria bacterium]HRS55333.1 PaaI family thioesterase [Desulfomonilia bacterium]HPD21724.1 PaaI family thioesterase [Deltaproteobacteria bacterium]HPX17421.1 PaaI family thioesterase [Deltaproteobacteria bacterium]